MGGGVAGFSPTADGGLAVTNEDGGPEVVDLSSGRIRWTRPPGPDPGAAATSMAVAGGALLAAVNGRLTSYDDQTGQVRWADQLMLPQLAGSMNAPGLEVSAGLVYLTLTGTQVLGISAADGRAEWRFAPAGVQSLNAYAPGLASVISDSGNTWQDELDPATGRVRWQVASSNDAMATPDGILTGPRTYESEPPDRTSQVSLHDMVTGQTRWISAPNGFATLPVFPDGPLLIVSAGGRDGPDLLTALRMSDGHRVWQVTIPEPLVAPLSAEPGGVLAYAANALFGT